MDIHNETTTDATSLVLDYASIGRRLMAMLLDGLILLLPVALVSQALPVVGGLMIWFLYGPMLESSSIRATLGKHLMGLQVSDLSGRRITFKASLIRNLMKIISTMFAFAGCIVAFFTTRKQALHDLLADTVVVYGRSATPIADAWLDNTKAVLRAVSGASQFDDGKRTSESLAGELERLQALKEKGVIAPSEFEAAKKKLLES